MFMMKILKYLIYFCRMTSLHGLIYIVTPKRHWCERVVWLLVVIVAGTGVCVLVVASWLRYNDNPIIIALDKSWQTWNVTLNSDSIRVLNYGIDEEAGDQYVQRTWNVSSGEKFDYYKRYVRAVGTSSILDIGNFSEFVNDETLQDVDKAEMAADVSIDPLRPLIRVVNWLNENGINIEDPVRKALLEVGIVQTFPGKMTLKLASTIMKTRAGSDNEYHCSLLAGTCFMLMNGFTQPIKALVHSDLEVPDLTAFKRGLVVPTKQLLVEYLHEGMVDSSSDIRKLSIRQRKCYFPDEAVYEGFSGYSMNICRLKCRQDQFQQLCGCVPFFYPQLGKTKNKVCDARGMICAASHQQDIIDSSYLTREMSSCKCLPACIERVYFREDYQYHSIDSSSFSHETAITTYSKSRYRRGIIFEFSDLLVNFGGILGLFLGCSLLTVIETGYFFTIGFIKFMWAKGKTGMRKKFGKQITPNERVEKIMARLGLARQNDIQRTNTN